MEALIKKRKNNKPIKNREKKIEKEIKVAVNDINKILNILRKVAKYKETIYMKDIIFGNNCHDNDKVKKIRLRARNGFNWSNIEVMYKYLAQENKNSWVKTEVEEIIYEGDNYEDALKVICEQSNFKQENSYEKIRSIYCRDNAKITLDIYPFGTFLEIEGEEGAIKETMKILNLNGTDIIKDNADDCYLKWNKEKGLKELWDVRFGLN